MGLLIAKGIQNIKRYFKKDNKIAVVGLDAGGKTTILYQMGFKQDLMNQNNFYTYKKDKISVIEQDLGIQERLQRLYIPLFENVDAIIFVFDMLDEDRYEQAKQELQKFTKSYIQNKIPLLIFGNKSDLKLLSIQQIDEILDLKSLQNVSNYIIFQSNAVQKEGIYEGFEWLQQQLQNKN